MSLVPGSHDELIGVTYLSIGGFTLETPTYFTLERDQPIAFVPYR